MRPADSTQIESARSFSTVYGTIKYGRNTVPTKRQFADIYDPKLYKTRVSIIVFGRLDHCNYRPEELVGSKIRQALLLDYPNYPRLQYIIPIFR